MSEKSQRVWLFDLDNTLHDASYAIFPAINENMNAFIGGVLQAENRPSHSAAVNAMRIAYWQRYGATLLGMLRHHAVKADDFLRDAHHFADLSAMIRAERGIASFLRRLPGRKILLTNAPRAYAREVLRHLGLHRHFATHLPIESMRVHREWRPKPSKLLLRRVLRQQGLSAGRCVLVEDSLPNIKSARALGLKTVWMTAYLARSHRRSAAAHVQVKSLRHLPKQLHRLR